MKAVVLAAGEGTRLEPARDGVPKPLVEVAGKPILTRCFESLLDAGFKQAVVVVGYRRREIKSKYGDSFGELDIEYAVQHEQKGVADAVLSAENHTGSNFAVLNGDNIYSANLTEAVEKHRSSDAEITFLTKNVSPEKAREGAVFRMKDGEITGIVEKPSDPPSNLAPAAFYILPTEIFPACRIIKPSDRGEYELPDAVDLLLYSGYSCETVPMEGWKVNINKPRDIERAEKKL